MIKYILLTTFLLLPGLLVSVKSILENTLFWQQKEYRIDRVWVQLKDLKNLNKQYIFLTILFIILFFISFQNNSIITSIKISIATIAATLAEIILILQSFSYLKKILKKNFLRPKISFRNILILLFSVLSVLVPLGLLFLASIKFLNAYFIIDCIDCYTKENYRFIFTVLTPAIFIILFINLIAPMSVAFFSVLTSPLALIKRQVSISKAKKKLPLHPNLKVIAITGSYGKTSTKEMLYKILSTKYKVAYTPKNMNTTIGIAQSILSEVKDDTEIFIAEMGAYKKGEIKKSTDLIAPDIAIVTNVGKAHLDIFGSVNNIAKTKFEIIEGLKKDGIAILNADNAHTLEMSNKTQNELLHFTIDDDYIANSNKYVQVSNITWEDSNVKFKIKSSFGNRVITTKVVGEHQLLNLIASLSCCLSLGFKPEELQELLKDKDFESSHFKQYEGKNGSIIIDDGYNSNPDGFDAALKHLSNTKRKVKVLVTKGIPEIGQEIMYIYENLAKQIIENVNVLITNDDLLLRKVKQLESKTKCILVKETEDFNKTIKEYLNDQTVILVEGRVNPETMNVLKNKE